MTATSGLSPAFETSAALDPLKHPDAPPDPSYMPQYRTPQQTEGLALGARADAYFNQGQSAAGTADKYVRLTVFLAAGLFSLALAADSRSGRHPIDWSSLRPCFSRYYPCKSSAFPDLRPDRS